MAQLDWYLHINLKARHLRLLIALADFGNLRQVADLSHVTVPAVSKALAELESGLGLELFTRSTRGLKPTPYGECLVRHARTMMTTIGQARDELKALSSGSEGKIHIGVYPLATSVLLPQALALFKRYTPGINVLVTEGTGQTLLPELWQGRLDLVVGRLPMAVDLHDFEERELLAAPVRLVTGAHHPLAACQALQWSDLRPYPWVLPPTTSLLRDPLERVLQQHGMSLANNYIETSSIHLASTYLRVTDAIAVMADAVVSSEPAHPLAVLPLSLPTMVRPIGVLWNKNRGLTPGARHMVSSLKAVAERQAALYDLNHHLATQAL